VPTSVIERTLSARGGNRMGMPKFNCDPCRIEAEEYRWDHGRATPRTAARWPKTVSELHQEQEDLRLIGGTYNTAVPKAVQTSKLSEEEEDTRLMQEMLETARRTSYWDYQNDSEQQQDPDDIVSLP
jgi:hypothetical protein